MSLPPGQIEAQSRRNFLKTFGTSMAGVSLSGIFDGAQVFAAPASTLLNPLAPKPQDFPAKAKACIYLYLYGGPSQMDLFDYKPDLQKSSGKKIKMEIRRREMRDSVLQGSKRTFAQHGRSGLWCSDALPNIAEHMDKLAVIKSLYMDSFAHGSANLQMNCGRVLQGHPGVGAWIAHGLGSSNGDLPGFVVMLDPRGGPIPGAANWTAGYMPAAYQGTVLRATGNPVLNLKPSANVTMEMQGDKVGAINALNELHRRGRESYSELGARIATYDLAYQLHTSAPEALDISSEDEKPGRAMGWTFPRAITSSVFPRLTSDDSASSRGAWWNAGCASCNSIRAVGTSSRTGMPITGWKRTCRFTAPRSTSRSQGFWKTLSSGDSSRKPWWSGVENSGVSRCRRVRMVDVITTPRASPTGWPEEE